METGLVLAAAVLCGACTFDISGVSPAPAGDGGAIDGDPADASEEAALENRGLVVRYYIDEAASGQAPALLRDAAPEPFDLALTYAQNEPSFVEQDGHRGLRWTMAGLDGQASAPLAPGSKVFDAFDGSTQGTIEAVFSASAVVDQGSRVAHIGEETRSRFSLESADINSLQLFTSEADDNALLGQFDIDLAASGRVVVHAVFDSSREAPADRVRFYVDGALRPDEMTPLSRDTALHIPEDPELYFALGNRKIGERSFAGTLYYAALYEVALSPEEVARNADLFAERDDAPH